MKFEELRTHSAYIVSRLNACSSRLNACSSRLNACSDSAPDYNLLRG
jgi:hypothetical protein